MRDDQDQTVVGERFPARVQSCFSKPDATMILKAHACALERSDTEGDTWPRIADILFDQCADAVVVTAALLIPPHQRGDLPMREIKSLFGDEIGNLIVRASSDPILSSHTEAPRIEDIRRWLTSISVDVRTLVLRVGLRLGTLEELARRIEDPDQDDDQDDHEQNDPKDIARETLELYVPLADRMGMGALRTRLEDACFHLLQPTVHAEISRSIEPIRAEDQICLSLLEDGIAQLLEQHSIDATIQSRTKGLYSIYSKMCRLNSSLDDVMDRIGLRIIVPSVEDCYQVLGHLHTRFRPVPGTFDDYIALPKENGYQSLHTCVYPVPDVSVKPVEFQIRTEEMHRQAEYGVAAHWLYKDRAEAEAEDRRQLERLRHLLPKSDKTFDLTTFLDRLHRRIDDDRLVVFRDNGHAMRLPANTTIGDLVRQLSASSDREILVQVNGVSHPPDYPLRDGDSIDLKVPEHRS